MNTKKINLVLSNIRIEILREIYDQQEESGERV